MEITAILVALLAVIVAIATLIASPILTPDPADRSGSPRLARSVTALLQILLLLAAVSPAEAHDELYYSAAECKPVNASHYNGNGANGLEWTAGIGWYNYSDVNIRILVCPVPYRRDVNNLAPIVVRAVFDDRHILSFASASLCRKTADASAPVCANASNFPTVIGISTIELSVTPDVNTRFVFLEARIPDREPFEPSSGRGTSGFIGYRVFRN